MTPTTSDLLYAIEQLKVELRKLADRVEELERWKQNKQDDDDNDYWSRMTNG